MEWLRWSIGASEWRFDVWRRWRVTHWLLLLVVVGVITLTGATWMSLADTKDLRLQVIASRQILLDRDGHPLAEDVSQWNVQDQIPLYKVPQRLQQAVLTAEDQRFYNHRGVDWLARAHAVWQGLKAGRNVRGASSITEQVVRMLVPRPRTLWSKWVEGFDAKRLERMVTKTDILEFYLNQVPYAANRRGVVSAAHYYFNRDVDTLDGREMLALAILPRAPSGLDPYRNGARFLDKRSVHLANEMRHDGFLNGDEWENIIETPLTLERHREEVTIGHFRNYVERQLQKSADLTKPQRVTTTLDGGLMQFTQALVDQRIAALKGRRVRNGAALIVDRRTGEILTWVVAGASPNTKTPGRYLDAVLIPRQPGSALKPFLYAASFDAGWSPGTRIEDAPLTEAVGTGMHQFNNYSRQFYGDVSVRQALGNSLNIPAIHTVNFVGPEHYLNLLHRLGFNSLTKSAGFYGDGLALGNGEVSLLEMVQGYTVLANEGVVKPLVAVKNNNPYKEQSKRIFSAQATSMVGNILSDPWARSLEFGRYSLLDLPIQTAVKTGTSTDYRDAWAIGYDSRYVVGIWMGNLDQSPTDGITGSTGPALVLRGLFAYLNRDQNSSKLTLDSELFLQENHRFSCRDCSQIVDLKSASTKSQSSGEDNSAPFIQQPSQNLRLAFDPRLPADKQSFRFILGSVGPEDKVTWIVNDEIAGISQGGDYNWRVERGQYVLDAEVERADGDTVSLGPVSFTVR
ncbi:MAG: transglycosylase domain-containing protein [Parvibaculum sp.]|nr:transglycosylase domain-containing protein [Parvibaculum sp.]